MKLSEVFNQLSSGELSQLNLGALINGEPPEKNYAPLVNHINLGLTELYTRFHLKQRRMTFPLQPDVVTYQFNLPDLIKIEKVETTDEVTLGLNDAQDPYTCRTSNLQTLVIPKEIVTAGADLPDWLKVDELTILYRANHPKLVLDESGYLDPDVATLELPYTHLQALLYFVASRAHNPVGMGNEFNSGNNWYQRFELACQQLEAKNVQIDPEYANTKLRDRGFV